MPAPNAKPATIGADKAASKRPIVGSGELQYEVDQRWAQRAERFTWHIPHHVALDLAGSVYVIHCGHADRLGLYPHDACLDQEGNIIVVEWVAGGRVSMLRKVK